MLKTDFKKKKSTNNNEPRSQHHGANSVKNKSVIHAELFKISDDQYGQGHETEDGDPS